MLYIICKLVGGKVKRAFNLNSSGINDTGIWKTYTTIIGNRSVVGVESGQYFRQGIIFGRDKEAKIIVVHKLRSYIQYYWGGGLNITENKWKLMISDVFNLQ